MRRVVSTVNKMSYDSSLARWIQICVTLGIDGLNQAECFTFSTVAPTWSFPAYLPGLPPDPGRTPPVS